jgi:predicted branched-subunit amino acid permease
MSSATKTASAAGVLRRNADVMRLALPFMFAAVTFGASFGVYARDAGMGTIAPVVMSATTFGGSAQFAVASILGAGGGLAAAIVAGILLNARYGPIGISVAHVIHGNALVRALKAQLVVDESWALANRGGREFDSRVLLGVGAALYVGWNTGTIVGVVAGDALGDPEKLGLDAAFGALFLALLVGVIDTRHALYGALAGGAIAFALIPFTQPGIPIIAACAGCLVGLLPNKRTERER